MISDSPDINLYLRRMMVENQLRGRIGDERVLDAMLHVPRHLFMPPETRPFAYEDRALPIGENQTISQPFMVAVMTELLEPREDDRALEIGTGSGYQAAVLSLLCRELFTVERIKPLYERATEKLAELGYDNVSTFLSDGTIGLPDHAPYDLIIVTAAAPDVPKPLLEQLADGGRLVAPVGLRYEQALVRIVRSGNEFLQSWSTPCVFVPLVGRHGFLSGDE